MNADVGMKPWKALPWLIVAGFLVRVAFAFSARNIHEPELHNYYEQAHRWVFGYGMVPWEWRFGLRTWLVPLFIGVPLQITKWVGVDSPASYVPLVKVMLCAASTTLIPSSYAAMRRWASEDAARATALLVAFWYELIFFAGRPLPELLAMYLLFGAVALIGSHSRSAPIVVGSLTALVVILRLQLAPVAGLVLVASAWHWPWPTRARSVAACVVVTVAGGAFDYVTWGGWFASQINTWLYNITYGLSAIYGLHHPLWYGAHLAIASGGLFVVAGLWSVRWWKHLWLPIAVVAAILVSHSLIGHKEYRFVVPAIPALLMVVAGVAVYETERQSFLLRRRLRGVIAAGLLGLSLAGAWNVLPWQQRIYEFVPTFAPDPSVDTYLWLSTEPSLTALYVTDEEWWHSAGYYHLHRDVPVYFLDDLVKMRRESGRGPEAYASHVLDRGFGIPTPGFEVVREWGTTQIRRNVTGQPLLVLQSYTRHMPEGAVDDWYVPWVRPFLTPPR